MPRKALDRSPSPTKNRQFEQRHGEAPASTAARRAGRAPPAGGSAQRLRPRPSPACPPAPASVRARPVSAAAATLARMAGDKGDKGFRRMAPPDYAALMAAFQAAGPDARDQQEEEAAARLAAAKAARRARGSWLLALAVAGFACWLFAVGSHGNPVWSAAALAFAAAALGARAAWFGYEVFWVPHAEHVSTGFRLIRQDGPAAPDDEAAAAAITDRSTRWLIGAIGATDTGVLWLAALVALAGAGWQVGVLAVGLAVLGCVAGLAALAVRVLYTRAARRPARA